ncbi:MAG TPA: DUF6364 family protein [Puia sp.]|jgi:hypothetical protein|nr:DUF6364 family protein [Puia sp.]
MTVKLTLTVEKEVIEKAKKYSSLTGRSLSKIVENYLESIVENEDNSPSKLSSKIKKLKGIIKLPKDFDYKKELEKAVKQKFK